MKYFGYCLLMIALVGFCSYSRQKEIRHDLNSALTWDDFKGRVDRGSKFAANTSSGFDFSASMVGDSMKVVLPTSFSPRESWVKKKQKSPHLLKHEQLHFDITELYVRKMRKEILAQKYTIKSFNKSVRKTLKKYSKESNAFQNKYDHQTKHSINKEQQQVWNKQVAESLKELEEYSVPVLMVKIKM